MSPPSSSTPRRVRGENHLLEVRGSMVYVKVGDAKHMTLEQGARDAQLLAQHLQEALEAAQQRLRGAIIDVVRAPSIAGPKTRRALSRSLEVWQRAGRPMAFVVGNDPIKQMQYVSLIRQYAPNHGTAVATQDQARTFCLEFPRGRR